ncbi:MAG TPA: type II toxin-antitoxin system VapC family toxin [Caulobacteraceae bacterium]|nr:type II toxin-antitoxin system VapC family toxin [Caulobacteraceae bacterium]
MKLLIDTHVLIWSATDQNSLPGRVREALASWSNQVWVSAAAAYEIEFKRARDPLLAQLPDDLDEAVTAQAFQWLAITQEHARAAGRLPRLHSDPFDRILVAQAFNEGATLVTADRRITNYGANVLW